MTETNRIFYDGDTIAGISTAAGGAVGIVRISGGNAARIAREVFIPGGRKTNTFQSHRFYYGHIKDNIGAVIDEALLVFMAAPKTYTREDVAELHVHGGRESLRRCLAAILNAGARAAEPGEFTKRAFLNGRIDLARAEAVMDIISAVSGKALATAERALEGRLSEAVNSAYDGLMYEIAAIETFLDSPDHAFGVVDGGYDLPGLSGRLEIILANLVKLHGTFQYGRVIKEGINTVIAGKPNVGKSSLLNALIGQERAIVTDIPGTTRDILTEHVSLGHNGLVLNLADTAGVRFDEGCDPVEKIGINKARKAISEAELVLFVVDGSAPVTVEDAAIAEYLAEAKKLVICVSNKTDLPKVKKGIMFTNVQAEIEISAKQKTGLDLLIKKIEEMFLTEHNENTVIVTNTRHADLLRKAANAVKSALETTERGLPEDLAAVELMDACGFLGAITGRNINEEIINTIFSTFCMGK
ncbi:MAG: tRNA uridine-5-carboxymethylaminomethyl(34) synthesis GTPase MnmE [Defluviitaleaceae bacterium]|nr:tRNA uridine-5-carboxymethylaminomethyl(34) synthesis GTPase MnmE [Defluviitaleaceae bacterium]MCL2835940.1 tRNA uridine-5-carboxymethylaminomethyl(34) synthesis GTPase MnmE [Defluviitaleaceae bacterium]